RRLVAHGLRRCRRPAAGGAQRDADRGAGAAARGRAAAAPGRRRSLRHHQGRSSSWPRPPRARRQRHAGAPLVRRARQPRDAALVPLGRPAGRYCAILLDGACHGGGRTMTAVVVIGAGGLALAQRLVATLPESRLHGYAPRIADADVRFDDVAAHLRALFARGEAIVALCAAGIVIRSLAPLLADKRTEPPVVAVAGDASCAVPLLGGPHGANDLARRIVALTGGTAAVTTAGDLQLGLALDDPPPGWRVANPDAAKVITAALLAGENVELVIEA